MHTYTGYNFMWIIDNSLDVHKLFNGRSNNLRNVNTYDFSTLYTPIPHHKLKNQLRWILSKAYATGYNYIRINGNFGRWCYEKKKEGNLFQRGRLIILML